MKAIIAVFGVGLLVLFFGAIMTAIGTFRGVAFTEPHVITSENDTATITLANPVLDDSTTNISILSDQTADAPIPFTYTSLNKHLIITGLDTNTASRVLTITYSVPRQDSVTDLLARYFPMFLILAGICIVIGACYEGIQRARGR